MSRFFETLEPRQLLAGSPTSLSASGDSYSANSSNFSAAQVLTLTNTGSATLSMSSCSIVGDNARDFVYDDSAMSRNLAPGSSTTLKVAFKPPSLDLFTATLQIASNDPDQPVMSITLRGLGTSGRSEDAEPSLHGAVLDAYQIPLAVGDSDPSTNILDGPVRSEEVAMPLLRRARTMVWFTRNCSRCIPGKPIPSARSVGTHPHRSRPSTSCSSPRREAQTLTPRIVGSIKFDPGDAPFGLYSSWTTQTHGDSFSEDSLNLPWDTTTLDHGRKVRFYPYKPNGRIVANAYVVAFEEAFNSDFQDGVMLIDNVMQLAPPAPPMRFAVSSRRQRAST